MREMGSGGGAGRKETQPLLPPYNYTVEPKGQGTHLSTYCYSLWHKVDIQQGRVEWCKLIGRETALSSLRMGTH